MVFYLCSVSRRDIDIESLTFISTKWKYTWLYRLFRRKLQVAV